MLEGLPIVTAEEMKRLEKKAFDSGENEEQFMENAGVGVGKIVEHYLVTPQTHETVYLLIGKGNNGGDAFVAGEYLLKKGFSVIAYHLFPLEECSPLCQKMGKRFQKRGGEVTHISSVPPFGKGVILDGLVGTGFKGAAEGFFKELIEGVNKSGLSVFAIDIPSGLNATTGKVETVAIKADWTLFLGLPKIGFFLHEGWDHCGKLLYVDFGLPERFLGEVEKVATFATREQTSKLLPPLKRSRHKYQAGYVLAVAGSKGFGGAAIMSAFATLKVGAGIVRLFYPQNAKEEFFNAPYELIKEEWDLKDDTRIFEEEGRAKALIIGPGMGRSKEMERAFINILSKTKLPTVIDADGLFFLSENPHLKLPEKTILTPHAKEMERLLGTPPTMEGCQKYAKEKKVTLVVKGAPTMIFHPHGEPLIIPHGDPAMASAGTGDILTGMIGGLVAQGVEMRDAAHLGVYLHALAGEICAEEETSYCLTATELLDFLPRAIQELQ